MGKYAKLFEELKAKISKHGSKKIIEKALIVAIVSVICLIAGSVLLDDTSKNKVTGPRTTVSNNVAGAAKTSGTDTSEVMKINNGETKNELETNLAAILSKIKGAGRVEVMVTYYSGNEAVPAADIKTSESDTQEKDKEGGTRSVKQTDKDNKIIYEEDQGTKRPFIVKELLPEVKGVVIVADGAGNAQVKSDLTIATAALVEVAAHKIQVFQRNNN